MREIPCQGCKYGNASEIVSSLVYDNLTKRGVTGKWTKITRKCPSCGATLKTYKIDPGTIAVGNMLPPSPPVMPDTIGPLRDERGRLLFDPVAVDPP